MNIILLSGGSGKRLWPLSNDVRSKQFIKIFKDDATGEYKSMLQRVYAQIKSADPYANITIATSKNQVSAIHNQLGADVDISIEPCRRDTFAAIALATAYLHDIHNIDGNEAVVVCPIDPYVDESYFECVKKLYAAAKYSDKNIVLMGIKPTYPSEKYGYIIPSGNEKFLFVEKPSKDKAEIYIKNGALWNGGVFAYKLKYVLNKSKILLGESNYNSLFANYENLRKISFDYAVVEHENSIEVLNYDGQWKDLGTWNTLTEAMHGNTIGDVRLSASCSNVHAVNELDIPIIINGIKDAVISASPDGILVSDKEQSSYIKPLVEHIDNQIMFAEKSWGSYRVIDVEENSLTVKVTLNAGHIMNYHSHERRDEIWNVISGKGRAIIDGIEKNIGPGNILTMHAGCKHTVIADTELQIIEIQIGKDISAQDKKIFRNEE